MSAPKAARSATQQRSAPWSALRFLWPRSFLGLILLSFTLITLPLCIALLHAASEVDELEQKGTGALYRAVAATQGSRLLVEHLTLLERKARQHAVLRDASSRDAFDEESRKAGEALNQLLRLAVPEDQKKALLALADGLRTLSVKLTASPAHEWTTAADFERLNDLAELVLARSNDLVLLEAGGLQEETREAKASLVWQAVAGLPLALVLAALFSLLISRPVRQIDRAVRRLGGGDFASPIVVSGPRDLAELGGAIDWLRLRLLELQEEKARFLARASHDLKTPLTAVREGAQLLLEEAVGPLGPEQQEVARILRDNSLRLQRSIQGLLDYSVSEARRGTSEDRVQRVALQALVREVLADNGPAAARKDLKLRSEGRDLWVLGDREQLRVALDNLISNSVKFTPAGGTLSVSVSASGDSAVIDLRDSGPGIAAEDRDHIFEDFYQGKATSDGPIRGSGLGLSIAREHVERHGGSLVVLEAREGAHLRLTLPVEKAEKNARPADTRARRAKTDREDER